VLRIHPIVKFIQAFAETCFDSSFGCSLPGGSGEREERETQGEGGGGGGGRLPRFLFFSFKLLFFFSLFVCLFVFFPSFVNSRDGNETFSFFLFMYRARASAVVASGSCFFFCGIRTPGVFLWLRGRGVIAFFVTTAACVVFWIFLLSFCNE
jgi:hypothetical protein